MIKKLLLFSAIAVFGLTSANAQYSSFGITAGYANLTAKLSNSSQNASISGSKSGFYVGFITDRPISEQFHIQPEVLYAHAGDGDFIYVPVLLKYYVADSGFFVMAGPQVTFALNIDDETTKAFGLDLSIGAGFDITRDFFIDARYSFNITNRLENAPDNVNLHLNTITIGVGVVF